MHTDMDGRVNNDVCPKSSEHSHTEYKNFETVLSDRGSTLDVHVSDRSCDDRPNEDHPPLHIVWPHRW